MWAAADDVWDREWIEVLLPVTKRFQCLAYGRVETIDSNGKSIPHPANHRRFEFQGTRIIRRMCYFLAPPFLGKANPIYGIIPRSKISDEDFLALNSVPRGSDTLFVYSLLNKLQVKSAYSVSLQKRVHSGCAGGDVIEKGKRSRSLFSRLARLSKALCLSQAEEYQSYSSVSSPVECFLLSISLPVALFLSGFHSARWFFVSKRLL